MEIAFTPADESDFEDLLGIRIEAMRESLERIGRFDPGRARLRLREGFSPAHTRHFWHAGEKAGFIVLKPTGGELSLDHLYILPRHQRKGIGAEVLKRIFAEADAAGLAIRVGALRGSASNAFYLRHGFEPAGEGEWDRYYVRKARPRSVQGCAGRSSDSSLST